MYTEICYKLMETTSHDTICKLVELNIHIQLLKMNTNFMIPVHKFNKDFIDQTYSQWLTYILKTIMHRIYKINMNIVITKFVHSLFY